MVAKGAGKRQQGAVGTCIYRAMLPALLSLVIGLQALGYWRFYIRKGFQWTVKGQLVLALIVLLDLPTFASTLRCAWSDPGFVPVVASKSQSAGECKKCGAAKQEGTYHCSKCGRCVSQMDHHCLVLDTCVGRDTFRYFAQFCIWHMVMIFVLEAVILWHVYTWNAQTAEGIRYVTMIWESYDPKGAFFGEPHLREAKQLILIDTVLLLVPVALGLYAYIQLTGLRENLLLGTNEVIKKYQPYKVPKHRTEAEVSAIIFGPNPTLARMLLPF